MARTIGAVRWLRWSFLLVGLLLLAGAGLAAWLELSFRQRAVETGGRVVQMIPRSGTDSDGRHSTTWTPVFAFRLPDGKEMRVVSGFSSSPACCSVGEAIRVRYDPADPSSAQMVGILASWLVTMILGGIGLTFTLVGLLVLRVTRRLGGVIAMAGAAPGMASFAVPLVGMRRAGTAHIVQARWTDPRSGVQRLFESPPIPFDPVPQMRRMDRVQVRFDPSRPNGPYVMDLSFLRAPGPGTTGPVRRG